MNRREARQAALCMIFDYSFHADDCPNEALELYIDNFRDVEEKCISEELRTDAYFQKVYFGVISNIPEIDEIIARFSQKWSAKRISRISMSILRLALYEILYVEDIPEQVSINEAVELSKKFDTDDSFTFVNGVLGAAVKALNTPMPIDQQETQNEDK